MLVQFWGSQGSYPKPMTNNELYDKIRQVLRRVVVSDIVSDESIEKFMKSLPFHMTHTYGGNTTSMSVVNEGEIFMFDAGTGIIQAGKELAAKHLLKTTDTVNIFISHTHWDHIHGLPFFAPVLWMKGVKVNIYSPMKSIQKRIEGQQYPQYLPFTFKDVPAEVNFFEVAEGEKVKFKSHTASFTKQYHPGGSYATRLDSNDGKSFGFTGDTELNVNSLQYFDRAVKFFRDIDILVCDTQYLLAEAFQKLDWGHSHTSVMLDLSIKANAKKMVLSHHEPSYSDEKIFEIHQKTKKYLKMIDKTSELEVLVAYNGLKIDI